MIPCHACGTLFEVHRKDHRFCSAKCRLAGFQQRQEQERRERDAHVMIKLRAAQQSVAEALGLLKEPPPTPPHEEDADARPGGPDHG